MHLNRSIFGFRSKSAQLAAAVSLSIAGLLGASNRANAAAISFTPFAAGDVIVSRAIGGVTGAGESPLAGGGVAATVLLDEYTPAGAFVQTVALPNAADATAGDNRALTFSGSANTEGQLSVSGNGAYITLAGYNQTATAATTTGTTGRTIGRIDWAGGAIDTSTFATNAFSTVTVRSATSTNGTDMYLTGGNQGAPNGGIQYTTFGTTAASVAVGTPGGTGDTKSVNIFNGNLYAATIKPSLHGIYNMGAPVTVATTNNGTALASPVSAAANSPADFWFKDASTLYVADIQTNASGGIQKYTSSDGGTTWTLAEIIQLGVSGTVNDIPDGAGSKGALGAESVYGTVDPITGAVTLYATALEGSGTTQDRLWQVLDNGTAATAVQNMLALSAVNSSFRGVVVTPTPEPVSLAVLGLAGLGLLRRSRRA